MIIILGTPGAGKTTQAKLLAEYLGCQWFSMGQLIRDNVKGKDRQDMLAGKIIGDGVTMKIVDQALATVETAKRECVFEGNPRAVTQAQWWLDQVAAGRFSITAVIHLVADSEVAEKRLVNRGRLDDHDDNVVETRFDEYKKSIKPTLEYLENHGVTVKQVDANGTIEEEAALIHKALGI
jgi:adenylate kinase